MLQEPYIPTMSPFESYKLIALSISLILSLLSIGLTLYLFYLKGKNESLEAKRNIKLDWYKILILESNLKHFHEFFENVEEEMNKLLVSKDEKLKKEVSEKINELNIKFRRRFIDSLLAVDELMYDNLMSLTDELIDSFTENIFDEGINLSHPPQFEKIITKELSVSKTQMIKELFKFTGEKEKISLGTKIKGFLNR